LQQVDRELNLNSGIMKSLNKNGLSEIQSYLKSSKLDENLREELLDHLACEAEERMWTGYSQEDVLKSIRTEVDLATLNELHLGHKHLLAMEKSLTEIVFENRNREYGAYVLRREYSANVQRATVIGVALFLFIFLVPSLYARLNPEPDPEAIVIEATLDNFIFEKKREIQPVEKQNRPPVKKTFKSDLVEVVQDHKVLNEVLPPTVDDLDDADPGSETTEGTGDVIALVTPPVEIWPDKKEATEVVQDNKIYTIAEQQPAYVGGMKALSEFLSKHMKYPGRAASAGVSGKVFIEFTVEADGAIENVHVIKGIGFGCDEEAVRVIKLMPNWIPGKQSGRSVRVKFTLPVAFQLE
jgi:protein TonB